MKCQRCKKKLYLLHHLFSLDKDFCDSCVTELNKEIREKKEITTLMSGNEKDKQHIELSYITHFYCDQKNIDSVFDLLREYESYDLATRQVVQFIIVDDCSPISYDIPHFDLNITWLKIDTDIPWNQAGARNLGVTYAKSDKIIMTDLDHKVPDVTFKHLIKRKNPGQNFYKIYRKHEGTIKKGHSNLFFMSRSRFLRFWGYDEEFSGNYGAEDFRFVKFQKYHGSRQMYLSKKYFCFERNVDRDDSYHSLYRDLSNNTPVDKRKHNEISNFGYEKGHSRLFLNFQWHLVKDVYLIKPELKRNLLWKHSWWLRYIFSSLSK